jgi:hypothetical protein
MSSLRSVLSEMRLPLWAIDSDGLAGKPIKMAREKGSET